MLWIWGSYTITLYGWTLLKGYDITFGELVSPAKPYGTVKGQAWPPPQLPNTVVLPGTRGAATATTAKLA